MPSVGKSQTQVARGIRALDRLETALNAGFDRVARSRAFLGPVSFALNLDSRARTRIPFPNWIPSGVGLREGLSALSPWIPVRGLREVGATPMEVVSTEGPLRLLRGKRPSSQKKALHRFPVVLIPSLINRYYVLDLLPERSLIADLLERGFDVFVVDWGAPAVEDQSLSLDELVSGRMRRAIEKAKRVSKASGIHLLGHCLGGTLSLAYGARYPRGISSIALVTAPVDFTGEDLLSVWSRYPGFDPELFVKAHGNTPWPMLQAAFHSVRPGTGLVKLLKATPRLAEENFASDFFAMETWGADNVSLPGGVFRDILNLFYRRNELMRGKLKIAGKRVGVRDSSCPILSIAGRADHIVLPETTLKDGPGRQVWISEGGHLGAILGRKAQKEVWPRMADWLSAIEAGNELAS